MEDAPFELLLLADPSKRNVQEYLQRGLCYIAANRSETIGVFVLLWTRPGTMEIVNIAVREEYQGQGIGKQLVLRAIGEAIKQHARTVEIGTGNSSLSQLGLYQKCGFRITGVDRDFFIRHYDEAIFENGIQCRDMIRLSYDLPETECR
ncbi:GNAT family N-acetyltransferase [Paenibacillus woosongensis]|uniref:Probable N-acetyltransferase 14 n=1 Tax=Paenibacillus woosongensis TaxID=307580 RepID=A0A7X2YX66_9BACL|nr:GNAT family N-acetyltransferase [Paenibacillus woosongensis]MUG43531.1 GNAT family N-acetyltransferase [Paenibacillus woosongensis]